METLMKWYPTIAIERLEVGFGGCVKLEGQQIAVFRYGPEEFYALSNCCPHKKQMVIARGLIGDLAGKPKVACALHKNQFSLETGKCLNTDLSSLKTYQVKLEEGQVCIGLP